MKESNDRKGSIDSKISSGEDEKPLMDRLHAINEIRRRINNIKEESSKSKSMLGKEKLMKYQVENNSSMEETEEENIDDLIEENNTIVSKIVSDTKKSKNVKII